MDGHATGIDGDKYTACDLLSTAERGPAYCGDYEQASGECTFFAGSSTCVFLVYIIDDQCYEHQNEYVQLTLGIPGAPAALGEQYVAKLRIDDDDFSELECYL